MPLAALPGVVPEALAPLGVPVPFVPLDELPELAVNLLPVLPAGVVPAVLPLVVVPEGLRVVVVVVPAVFPPVVVPAELPADVVPVGLAEMFLVVVVVLVGLGLL